MATAHATAFTECLAKHGMCAPTGLLCRGPDSPADSIRDVHRLAAGRFRSKLPRAYSLQHKLPGGASRLQLKVDIDVDRGLSNTRFSRALVV